MQAARCPSFECQYPANLRTNAIPTTSLLVNSDIILRLSPQICGSSQSRKSSVFRKPNMATLSSRGTHLGQNQVIDFIRCRPHSPQKFHISTPKIFN